MKVIVAAFPKCGTKTMAQALRGLGLTVYDAIENYEYLWRDWEKIFKEGATAEDFRRMYADVDAVTDVPACYFWEEILEAFPDAKIVFLKRDTEEIWWNSMKGQIASGNGLQLTIMSILSPTFAHLNWFFSLMVRGIWGLEQRRTWTGLISNELLMRMTYRRHNAYVLAKAPKEQLLEYNVRDGWGPLCQFLGVPVPDDKPFPHRNKNASIVKELFATNPTFIRMQREMKISSALLSALSLYLLYKLYRNRSSVSLSPVSALFSSVRTYLLAPTS